MDFGPYVIIIIIIIIGLFIFYMRILLKMIFWFNVLKLEIRL